MTINLKSFVNRVKSGINSTGNTMNNIYKTAVQNKITTPLKQKKVINGMMAKEYVSPTMGTQTWNKRRKETKVLVKQGKMKQARTNLQNLTKQFKEDN